MTRDSISGEQLRAAIQYLSYAQGALGAIDRDLVDAEGSLVGLPSTKDLVNDCMDMIDEIIDTLEDL